MTSLNCAPAWRNSSLAETDPTRQYKLEQRFTLYPATLITPALPPEQPVESTHMSGPIMFTSVFTNQIEAKLPKTSPTNLIHFGEDRFVDANEESA